MPLLALLPKPMYQSLEVNFKKEAALQLDNMSAALRVIFDTLFPDHKDQFSEVFSVDTLRDILSSLVNQSDKLQTEIDAPATDDPVSTLQLSRIEEEQIKLTQADPFLKKSLTESKNIGRYTSIDSDFGHSKEDVVGKKSIFIA